MRGWLRLTHLFGLHEGHCPDNLMLAALGPVLSAACQDIVGAPLPEPIARLVQELALRERTYPRGAHPQAEAQAPSPFVRRASMISRRDRAA